MQRLRSNPRKVWTSQWSVILHTFYRQILFWVALELLVWWYMIYDVSILGKIINYGFLSSEIKMMMMMMMMMIWYDIIFSIITNIFASPEIKLSGQDVADEISVEQDEWEAQSILEFFVRPWKRYRGFLWCHEAIAGVPPRKGRSSWCVGISFTHTKKLILEVIWDSCSLCFLCALAFWRHSSLESGHRAWIEWFALSTRALASPQRQDFGCATVSDSCFRKKSSCSMVWFWRMVLI